MLGWQKWAAAVFGVAAMGITAGAMAAEPPVYKDAAAPVERRVQDLLSRMTLAEKIQQLRCIEGLPAKITQGGTFDAKKAAALLAGGIGEVAPMDDDAVREVALRNAAQHYLIEQTRLGIPAIFHDEACHGFRDIGATSFPAPIGLACSWDPGMVEKIYNTVANEMRARGVSHALAPVVDIDRDPRWGRTDETMGEDPYLNGTIGAAVVRGLQGSDDGTIAPGHVAATLKHLTGHGQPEGGINRSPGDVPLRELWDAHLVPFRIAIAQGHPAAVMPSYNEVDGVPSHVNTWLLQDVLRQALHFDGLIVSDYSGIEYLVTAHAVAANDREAARRAFNAGVDVNLPDGRAFSNLAGLVNDGKISMSQLDAAVGRVLKLKFELELFESPYGDAEQSAALPKLQVTRALARRAADESIVLLRNKAGVLPLAAGKYKTIAVIGPNAAEARLGSYSGVPTYSVTVLDGIKARAGNSAKVVYAEGCKITTNLPKRSMDAWKDSIMAAFPTEEQTRADVADAVKTARQADLIVLVLGENETISREAWSASHLGDRSSLELAGGQNELAEAMLNLGKPVVVYLMNGRPVAIPWIVDKADAVVEGWYMGQETGSAVADVLFGDVNPSGKLTISFPRVTGQVPDYYDYKPGARLYNYVDSTNQPLFSFGYGLSYSTFEYSTPVLSAPSMSRDGQVSVSTTVTNASNTAGDEIVEFYIRQRFTSVTRPVKELKGFKRISLAAGQSKSVSFPVSAATLAFHDIQMNYTVEPGDVDLMIGGTAATTKKTTLRITD